MSEFACKPSHLDLCCLQRYLFWSAGIKGLKVKWKYHALFGGKKKILKCLQLFEFSIPV